MEILKHIFELHGENITHRQVHSLYGVSMYTLIILWEILQKIEIPYSILPFHLLWTLNFLKNYPTCDNGASHYNCDVKTYRLYIWRTIFMLYLYFQTVDLNLRTIGTENCSIKLAIDGTDCPIQRPSDWNVQKFFYSGYKKKHSVKYEVGVNWVTGLICWVAGPTGGSRHDITLCRQQGILSQRHLLDRGEMCWADKGYIGKDGLFITPVKNPQNDLELGWNHFVHSHRWIVENVLDRLKNFRCLSVKWRHSLMLHGIVFNVICNITNVDMYFYPVRK